MKHYKMGELCQIKHGFPFKGEYFSDAGNYIVLTPANFYEKGGFKRVPGKEKFYLSDFPQEYLCSKGDLIIAMTQQAEGLLGSTAIVPEDGVYLHNQRIGLISVNEDLVDKDFLYFLFMTDMIRKQIRNSASGTKVKHTSPEKIADVDVYIPSKEVQKRNAAFLKLLEEKKTVNEETICAIERIASKLYDYWFVQFEFPNEEGKPYRSSGGEMVWCDELKQDIPKSWRTTSIGDITICLDSKRIPLSEKEREKIRGNIPYYGASGVMDYVNDYIFDGDYVLFAEDGSVMNKNGNPILQRITGKNWVNNHTHVLKPVEGYSCMLLMMLFKNIPVVKIKTGSIQMKINQANLNRYRLIEIPKGLRESIIKFLDPLDRLILQKKAELLELQRQIDWLLPLLMNGQATII